MKRRNFIVDFLLWTLAFFFGYTINEKGQNINLLKTEANKVLNKNITSLLVNITQFPVQDHEVDDTGRFQRAVDYAIANNKKIVGFKGQIFTVSSPIIINHFVDINLGGATIKVDGNISSIFHINYRKGELTLDNNKTARISDIDFDCGNASIAIYGEYVRKTEFNSIKFKNLLGTAFRLDDGYEVICNRWDIVASETKSIGLDLRTSDCQFTDIIMLGCYTAIRNYGSNILTGIHAWPLSTNSSGSIYLEHTGGDLFLNNCCCDTYATGVKKVTGERLSINQLKFIINTSNYKENTVKVFEFKSNSSITDEELSRYVMMSNSVIKGATGITTYLSNLKGDKCHILGLIGTNDFYLITGVENADISTLTLDSNNFILGDINADKTFVRLSRKGNRVLCEGKLKAVKTLTTEIEYNLGTFPEYFKPVYEKPIPVVFSLNAWGAFSHAGWGYVNSNNITVMHSAGSGANMNYVAFSFEYDVPYYK